ncbi:hypothetical protein LINGRAHAP2_LOCUS7782 [Linum grandiflorum]
MKMDSQFRLICLQVQLSDWKLSLNLGALSSNESMASSLSEMAFDTNTLEEFNSSSRANNRAGGYLWSDLTNISRLHQKIVQRVMDDIEEWLSYHNEGHTYGDPMFVCPMWHPPQAGYVKCNVDIALFAQKASHGVGMVIRNSSARCYIA